MDNRQEQQIKLMINGEMWEVNVKSSATLLEVLRDKLDLTGTKEACGTGECGACTVLIDGKVAYACLMLAVDAKGKNITTIEGIAELQAQGVWEHSWPPGKNVITIEGISGCKLDPIQQSILEHGGLQCGFCTPAKVLAAKAMFHEYPLDQITPDLVKQELAGHLCRCEYTRTVKAIVDAAKKMAAEEAG